MEEKTLNEKESIELIASMIERTKTRLHLGDGNLFLLWGYTSVTVAALVGILLYLTHNQVVNWLWFLIWIVGGIVHPHMVKKQELKVGVKTYTDRLSNAVWSMVGWIAIGSVLLCLGFMLFAGKDIWIMMLVMSFLVLGFCEIVQGIIVCEKSMMAGGCVSLLMGMLTLACVIAQIPLGVVWYIPMFIVAFTCMLIIPGHILNAKARKNV